jgi:hypothetical protein
MDIAMFLRFAEAIRAIYELGFEPREDSFTECTLEQYSSLERQGHDRTKRWFIVTGGWLGPESRSEELLLVDESERQLLLATRAWIVKTTDTSGGPFSSSQERLQSLTRSLPDVLWKPAASEKQRPRLGLVP